jgi:sec-independent protein translocase protein TatB
VARTLGHLAGRLQRYVADVKADINREIELDELRKMRDEVQKAASNIEASVTAEVSKTQTELDKTADELNKSVQAAVEVRPQEPVTSQEAAMDRKPADK